jgi:anti-sigma factor RsiW
MDHKQALQTKAAEKYLLGELAPEDRDAFEEHYFSCHECAQDMAAGAALMESGKRLFLEERQQPPVRIETSVGTEPAATQPDRASRQAPEKKEWFAWLRPAFAIPAFALLLLVVGFQNLVQLPGLQRSLTAANSPEVLPSAYLASGGARGGDEHVITARAGQQSLLVIDIPGPANAEYTAELYDSAGQKKWSLAIPESVGKEGLTLRLPGNLEAGDYALSVKTAGDAKEVARYGFDLKR